MWYIGIDAHKAKCHLTAKDKDGTTKRTKIFEHTPDGWTKALAEFGPGSHVAVECVSWYQPIFDLLDEQGYQGHLVHAKDVALIAKSKRKTDARDSETLCDLLRTGFLPEAHVPGIETRRLRELTRHQDDVVKRQTSCKNRIHRLLERAWIQTPGVTDLFGKEGRRFLSTLRLDRGMQLVLDSLLQELDALQTIRQGLEGAVALEIQGDDDARLLMTTDGLSVMGAATLRAEIDTAQRFPNRKAIRSNFGLAVSVRNSADTEHRGHITKQGPGQVRKIVVQGAQHFVRRNPAAQEKNDRLRRRRGASVARVAVGAMLLSTAYQMLKNQEPYRYATPASIARKEKALLKMTKQAPSTYVS